MGGAEVCVDGGIQAVCTGESFSYGVEHRGGEASILDGFDECDFSGAVAGEACVS